MKIIKNETHGVRLGTLLIIIGGLMNPLFIIVFSIEKPEYWYLIGLGLLFSLMGAYFIISERIKMKETKKLLSSLIPLSIIIVMLVIYFIFINKEQIIQ